MTSLSSQEGVEAMVEKENGKEMKFEISKPSKQPEGKEQSLKAREETLSKQAASLKG